MFLGIILLCEKLEAIALALLGQVLHQEDKSAKFIIINFKTICTAGIWHFLMFDKVC